MIINFKLYFISSNMLYLLENVFLFRIQLIIITFIIFKKIIIQCKIIFIIHHHLIILTYLNFVRTHFNYQIISTPSIFLNNWIS